MLMCDVDSVRILLIKYVGHTAICSHLTHAVDYIYPVLVIVYTPPRLTYTGKVLYMCIPYYRIAHVYLNRFTA
jgi:hypothetical protein